MLEFLFIAALGALALLVGQRLAAKARRTRKAVAAKATASVRRTRAALGTQTVATTRRKKNSRGGARR
ncbi:hypothetical protein [Nocardiopsis sp. NPDC006938]|uniref:hypothetical protein n=1 Tax=Nocardiopsis sp. NPDC006938 TaxID=3364337 RepID=UPI0036CCC435